MDQNSIMTLVEALVACVFQEVAPRCLAKHMSCATKLMQPQAVQVFGAWLQQPIGQVRMGVLQGSLLHNMLLRWRVWSWRSPSRA